MTRLALGLKCGAFVVKGLATLAAPSACCSCRRDPSAIEPRPTPHCLKNQRRVIRRAYSERSSLLRFVVTGQILLHCSYSFVMVSSRFRSALLTIAHAAALCIFT